MRLVNDANAEQNFYVGNCKNNTPPKHVAVEGKIAEGTETKDVSIDGSPATLVKTPKSAEYIYVKSGDQWLWVKDPNIFTGTQTTFVKAVKPEPAPKAPKEKSDKPAKAPKGDTPESIGLDLKATYNVYGTEMTGEAAKKRFGLKNIKDGLASGKITKAGEEDPANNAAGAEESA